MVVSVHGDDIGEQVAALESKVLDDEVQRFVRVLDAGNGDVANLRDELREDDSAHVIPEIGLELEGALAIEEKVASETGPVLAKLTVDLVEI